MVNLMQLKTDTLRKMYKKLNPDITFAVIKSYSKCQLAEKLNYNEKKLKNTLNSVLRIPKEKEIKTVRDYLNTLNKYQVRKVASQVNVLGISRPKSELINDIVKNEKSLQNIKKIKV
jgi:hypothetical protein